MPSPAWTEGSTPVTSGTSIASSSHARHEGEAPRPGALQEVTRIFVSDRGSSCSNLCQPTEWRRRRIEEVSKRGESYRWPGMEDHDLVLAARDGDKDAFAAIYDRYGDRLYDFLLLACCGTATRPPTSSTTPSSSPAPGSTSCSDPAKLRPWLYAIARHEALRRLRQKARQEPVEELEVTATAPRPDDRRRPGRAARAGGRRGPGPEPSGPRRARPPPAPGPRRPGAGRRHRRERQHAYVLLSRLRDQVERSLGALLVARMGRKRLRGARRHPRRLGRPLLPARAASGWPATSTVARRAATVAATLVSPLSLLSAAPAIAAPAAVRRRVLDDVQLVSHTGRPMRGWRRLPAAAATGGAGPGRSSPPPRWQP